MNEEGELKDVIMTWVQDPTKAREYAEGQTNGMRYVIRREGQKKRFWLGSQSVERRRL
jgi:hypothetical protein